MDHLLWLGVHAVRICPFHRSPTTDIGYDVTDHCDVDLGTLDGCDRLVAEAHARGTGWSCTGDPAPLPEDPGRPPGQPSPVDRAAAGVLDVGGLAGTVLGYERGGGADRRVVLVNFSSEPAAGDLTWTWSVEVDSDRTGEGATFTGAVGGDQAPVLRPASPGGARPD